MKRSLRHFFSLALSLTMLVSLAWMSNLALASDPPTFSAEITNTHKITLTFSKDMQTPYGLGSGGFSYTINGAAQTINSISYNSSSPRVYVLELHTGIQPGNTVTLSYTPPETNPIQSDDGGELASVSGLTLTNNLNTTAPNIFVVTTQDDNNNTNNDGTYISVAFTLRMADPPVAPGGFTVTADGNNVAVTDIYRKPLFDKVYVIRLETPIQYGQKVLLSYTPGTVQSFYGVPMAENKDHNVNNQVPQPVSADLTNITLSGSPTNYTFSSSIYTYNNVMVANNVAGITVTPTGAGTITVDGTEVVTGTATGEIDLTAGVERTILVTTTETGKATRTYAIKVTRLGSQVAPTFIPAQGAVAFGSELQIISANADHIYYTTDGSMPGTSVGGKTLEYNDSARPIINQTMTVRAIAVKAGWGNSAYSTADYTQASSANLTGLVLSGSPVNFTFSGGTYTYNNVMVANNVAGIIVTPTGTGTITVDGTEVVTGTATGEIDLTAGVERTILVTTTETGKATRTYTIKITRLMSQVAPTFIPAQGAVAFGSELQIISANADHIYYTTDGSMPGTSVGGTTLEYNDSARPIINQTMTVCAIAVKAGWWNSAYSTAVYTQASSANLTGLVLSGSPANFTFSGCTYTYNNVTVANNVDRITVTPTGDGTIIVNGTVVATGTASGEIHLTPGTEETIMVSSKENGKSPKTYIIKVTRARSTGHGSSVPVYSADVSGGGTFNVTVDKASNSASVPAKPVTPQPTVNIPSDISGHWAKSSIMKMINAGVISGYLDGTFKPDKAVTRAEFTVMLVKALNLETSNGKTFTDTTSHWAKDNIATAAAHGIISGYDENTFGPDDLITREQAAVIIARAAKLETTTDELNFTDSKAISPWAKPGVAAAFKGGFINGYPDGSFKPQGNTTRAEATVIIGKLLK